MAEVPHYVPPSGDITPIDVLVDFKVNQPQMGMHMSEFDDLHSVLAFDPGGTTGWAVIAIHPDALRPPGADGIAYKILDNIVFWSAGQFTGTEAEMADAMVELVKAWPGRSPLVVEDFILRVYRRDRTLLSPVRITARFEHAVRYTGFAERQRSGPGRQIILQGPSMAMSVATDERLKTWGFYNATAGQPHARDAVRHAITFLRREKEARAGKRTLDPNKL